MVRLRRVVISIPVLLIATVATSFGVLDKQVH